MKFNEKYEKTTKNQEKVQISDDFYAIGELLEQINNKLAKLLLK